MNRALAFVAASLLVVCLGSAAEAQDRPYTEEPVLQVSYIRIEPGMFDRYMSLRDRAEPITRGVLQKTPEEAAQASIEREEMRELVGGRLLRQLILK
ncbi:MAG: hypothetical protein ABR599_01250 [Gemmatimonadota bacterium]